MDVKKNQKEDHLGGKGILVQLIRKKKSRKLQFVMIQGLFRVIGKF